MLTIVEDKVGRHDFLYSPCSLEMYRIQYGVTGYHANCHDNLLSALRELGIGEPGAGGAGAAGSKQKPLMSFWVRPSANVHRPSRLAPHLFMRHRRHALRLAPA